jgi:hypothetical protein
MEKFPLTVQGTCQRSLPSVACAPLQTSAHSHEEQHMEKPETLFSHKYLCVMLIFW